jgi:hypothetical protein
MTIGQLHEHLRRTLTWVRVGAGLCVVREAREYDRVQGAVELPVTATVDAVEDDRPRRGGDRRDAGQGGKRRLGAGPAAVRPGAEDLCRADRTDARLGKQLRGMLPHKQLEQRFVVEVAGEGCLGQAVSE